MQRAGQQTRQPRRPRSDLAAAAERLADEVLVRVYAIAVELGISERTVVRWIVSGKGGRFLDGLHRPGRGWLTSREALLRFTEGVEGVVPLPAV